MLSDDFLYQLRQNNPIETVMSSYTNLRKRGRNYVCLCPFHSEKTPSCTVYTDNSSFYCFGCGAGGDVITFIRQIENLDYIEAVKLLAERAGMSMPEDAVDSRAAFVKARTLELNRDAAKFFFSVLKTKDGEKGVRYIKSRELKPETVTKYGLGYAPNSWTSLHDAMRSKGYTDDELITAALCGRSQTGRVYDLFRDRVIFPIIDLRGNVIAFGGRIIDGEGPKYLNSGDTTVFKKSRNLFSLNFAKNSKKDKLILAEGYMDVISINQAGFENVVATLGTALTPEQARIMAHYAKEVIISYDSDEAGQKATHRAINLLSEAGVDAKIIKMEGAKDPDEYIKKFGATRFELLLDNSSGAIIFELEKCKAGLDIENEADRVTYLKRSIKVLCEISSPLERDVYISRIASQQDVSRDIITAQVNAAIKRKIDASKKQEWNIITSGTVQRSASPEERKYRREEKAERGILAYLFSNPDKLGFITSKLTEENFPTSLNRRIYSVLTERMKNSLDFSLSSLSDVFSVEEMGKISEMLAKSRDIALSDSVIEDYIDILLSFKDTPDGELSDDEFLKFAEQLKKSQKNKE